MATPTKEESVSFAPPDPLVPAQYFETFRSRGKLEPEKRLLLAILEDAIFCFFKYARSRSRHGQRLFRDAEQWIFSQNKEWSCSFENVCLALDIDPEYVRRGLMAAKQKMSARPVDSAPRLVGRRARKKLRFAA
ncbi:MAG TPA: hypothetical protein VNL14_11005 [Candidatus Acidoferrales bacterium]|nr:hypothetical protein [Candidatus Acidoferrales bacterium]